MNGNLPLPLALVLGVDPWIFSFSFITVAATIWMGFWAARRSKTASDFFVAGRSVSVGWNASAISGEYLSAASFMGVAGMVMSGAALLARKPAVTREEAQQALAGNLCRCGTHERILRAVLRASRKSAA